MEFDYLLMESGLPKSKSAISFLNNKYFYYWFLVIFGFLAHVIESAYLLRRWGRVAVYKLTLDVKNDDQIKIRLYRHKTWFLSDR